MPKKHSRLLSHKSGVLCKTIYLIIRSDKSTLCTSSRLKI